MTIPVGDFPVDIQVAPDGSVAGVIGDAQASRCSVIDLAAQSVVGGLAVAAIVDAAVSPVSHRLVGLNNRSGEDLNFYTTNGSTSQFLGSTPSGEEPEVDAPRRATAIPGTTRALVTGLHSRSVAEIDTTSGAVVNVYTAGERVWEAATDAAGTVAVVTCTDSDEAYVLDLNAGDVVAVLSVPVAPTEVAVSADGSQAYATSVRSSDRIWILDLNGAASLDADGVPVGQLGSYPLHYNETSGMALSPNEQTLAVCASFNNELQLIDLTPFCGNATTECTGGPNSLGSPASIAAQGTFLAGGLPLTLLATNLPANQPGLMLTSQTPGNRFLVLNSQGRLCLAGSIGRFVSLTASSGPSGMIAVEVDTTTVPTGPGNVAIQSGETWYFQLWYRDINRGTANRIHTRHPAAGTSGPSWCRCWASADPSWSRRVRTFPCSSTHRRSRRWSRTGWRHRGDRFRCGFRFRPCRPSGWGRRRTR